LTNFSPDLHTQIDWNQPGLPEKKHSKALYAPMPPLPELIENLFYPQCLWITSNLSVDNPDLFGG
jgi:hypothetical protein